MLGSDQHRFILTQKRRMKEKPHSRQPSGGELAFPPEQRLGPPLRAQTMANPPNKGIPPLDPNLKSNRPCSPSHHHHQALRMMAHVKANRKLGCRGLQSVISFLRACRNGKMEMDSNNNLYFVSYILIILYKCNKICASACTQCDNTYCPSCYSPATLTLSNTCIKNSPPSH